MVKVSFDSCKFGLYSCLCARIHTLSLSDTHKTLWALPHRLEVHVSCFRTESSRIEQRWRFELGLMIEMGAEVR